MPTDVSFVVFPDSDGSQAAARRLCDAPGVQLVSHASGRPWIVGRWPVGGLTVAAAGRARVALAGHSPADADHLDRVVRQRPDLSAVDALARTVRGSAHLAASAGGKVRVQGTASGVRRVFHSRLDGVTVAADRPDTLARLIGADIDDELLALRLLAPTASYLLNERPVWRKVHQVTPGHCLVLDAEGRARTTRWWTPPAADRSLEDGAPAVRDALVDAVHYRVKDAGAASTDLSGGMDSGAVAHLAADKAASLTTIRTPQLDRGGDDALWARRLTDQLPDAEHLLLEYEQAPTMFAGLDTGEGMTVPAGPPHWVRSGARFADVCRQAADRGSRLHLCGHGGDEIFVPPASHLHSLVRSHPRLAVRAVRGRRAMTRWPLGATWRALADSRDFPSWLAHCANRLDAPPASPFAPQTGWTPMLRIPPWATPKAADAARELLLRTAGEHPEPLAPGRGTHETLDRIHLAGAAVHYAERLMAAHGIRFAAPYLDDRVIEAALAVRPHERGTPDRYKPLLAHAMRGLVPDTMLQRTTKGAYDEDTYDGLRRHRRTLLSLFEGSRLARLGLVDDAAVRNVLRTSHPTVVPLRDLEPTLACEVWLRSRAAQERSPGTAPAADDLEGIL
ncbi:asparagine synthase-related protein [Streptomyces morookaense]|uniref:asparagine synthase (glutamine-hydrolyzing) n=1 Tax=Streptomyces morookaense TaxID=1970 RepID=A0A7Y7E952_STRMO|nr:asparagine synthase-related protein [Streptomyces morookaense]NVK80042.1 hypothetical protein [Streptomyces morookaense]